MDRNTKNLLFLFGAAPMGLAGCISSDDGSDTYLTLTTATTVSNDEETTNDAGDGDGDSTSGDGDGDGDGDPTTGDGDGDSGDGDGDSGDGDGDSGDGDGDSGDGDGDGDGDSTTGGDVGALCTPYSETIGMCYGDMYTADAYTGCSTYYDMFSGDPACLSAFEAFIVCLSGLPCGDLGDALGCESELADYQANCA